MLLIRTTAYEVIRHATVPVLLQIIEVLRELGQVKCRQVCEQVLERVLHPTDFSDPAEAAFQVIKHFKAAGA